jgi:hydrogenase maturation protein HypF
LFNRVGPKDIAVVRRMLSAGVNTTAAHGVGRYFDAVGALGLGRVESRHEGQVALEWNLAADPNEDGGYPFAVGEGSHGCELDLRPAVRVLAAELTGGVSPGAVSARFHNTLAAATAELIELARRQAGDVPVVLSGGVFQNAMLVDRVSRAVRPGVPVLRHGTVPPGDGGLALGQAVIASAVVRAGRREVLEEVCA